MPHISHLHSRTFRFARQLTESSLIFVVSFRETMEADRWAGLRELRGWSYRAERTRLRGLYPAAIPGKTPGLLRGWPLCPGNERVKKLLEQPARGWTEVASRWQVRRVSISYESTRARNRWGGSRKRLDESTWSLSRIADSG